jgi:hypothetical protein
MNIFFESPMPVIFLGIVIEAVLGIALFTTRRGVLLLPMAVVVLLVLGGVWLERVIVTETERVEATLDDVADALKANDLSKLYTYISPAARYTRDRAAWALGYIEVTDAKIRNLAVTINRLTSPATAEAKFDGIIFFRGKRVEVGGRDRYPARFTVQLELDGDRWLVTDHIEYEQVNL